MIIDLRSDTVTQPTAAMLEAMQHATFGDDSRDGDATVQRLEALAAGRTGKEAGLYLPSGTMANLVALLAHADRGGEVLLEQGSHILNSELGGVSNLAGMFCTGLPGQRGAMDLDALRAHIRAKMSRKQLGTALVWMETTHNGAGGAALPLGHMAEACAIAGEHGVPVHIDGARLFNAAIALGVSAKEIARHAGSVCFCISKGLSAPIGSLLCGTSEFIERARGFRRMVGGNLRQAGPIAAAGIVALESMVDRLADDHRTARRLAHGLYDIDAGIVDPALVESNLVLASVRPRGGNAAEWSAALKVAGVLVNPARAAAELRFVTHRHVGDTEIDHALGVIARTWRQFEIADATPGHTGPTHETGPISRA